MYAPAVKKKKEKKNWVLVLSELATLEPPEQNNDRHHRVVRFAATPEHTMITLRH